MERIKAKLLLGMKLTETEEAKIMLFGDELIADVKYINTIKASKADIKCLTNDIINNNVKFVLKLTRKGNLAIDTID